MQRGQAEALRAKWWVSAEKTGSSITCKMVSVCREDRQQHYVQNGGCLQRGQAARRALEADSRHKRTTAKGKTAKGKVTL